MQGWREVVDSRGTDCRRADRSGGQVLPSSLTRGVSRGIGLVLPSGALLLP